MSNANTLSDQGSGMRVSQRSIDNREGTARTCDGSANGGRIARSQKDLLREHTTLKVHARE
jgi:hypothetical protein